MRCKSITQKGSRCRRQCNNSHGYCHIHSDDCPICLNNLASHDDVCKLRCGHTFHSGCLYQWNYQDCRCPCCRTAVLTPRRVEVYHHGSYDTSIVERGHIQKYIRDDLFSKCYTTKIRLNWGDTFVEVYDMLNNTHVENLDIKIFE